MREFKSQKVHYLTKVENDKVRERMLNIKIYRDEFVQIVDDIKIYFNGGEYDFAKRGIEAPKEMNIVRYEPKENQQTEKYTTVGKKGNKIFIVNGEKKIVRPEE